MGEENHKQVAGVMHVERRASHRLPAQLRLLFPWGTRIVQALTQDISATGMRFETPIEIPKGTRLLMHFAPLGETTTQRLEGMVMWVTPPTGNSGRYMSGFHFVNLSAEAKASISRITEPHEVELVEADLVHDTDIHDTKPEQELQAHTQAQDFASPHADFAAELSQAVTRDKHQQQERREKANQLVILAHAAVGGGTVAHAVKLLEEALQLVPESREITEELARALYLRGDVVRAAELFDRALRLSQEGS